jgi:hypothetical protein
VLSTGHMLSTDHMLSADNLMLSYEILSFDIMLSVNMMLSDMLPDFFLLENTPGKNALPHKQKQKTMAPSTAMSKFITLLVKQFCYQFLWRTY